MRQADALIIEGVLLLWRASEVLHLPPTADPWLPVAQVLPSCSRQAFFSLSDWGRDEHTETNSTPPQPESEAN